MAAAQGPTTMQFQTWASDVHVSFWWELGRDKLEVYGLGAREIPLHGRFTSSSARPAAVASPQLTFERARGVDVRNDERCCSAGTLWIANTVEEFRAQAKAAVAFVQRLGSALDAAVASGAAFRCPSMLFAASAMAFPDLKYHKYAYWFCFTTICPADWVVQQRRPPSAPLPAAWLLPLLDTYRLWGRACGVELPPGAVAVDAHENEGGAEEAEEAAAAGGLSVPRQPAFWLVRPEQPSSADPGAVHPFEWWTPERHVAGGRTLLVFVDGCAVDGHPGWALRNLLYAVAFRRRAAGAKGPLELDCLSLRDVVPRAGAALQSRLFHLTVPELPAGAALQFRGWERDAKSGKLRARRVDLSALMPQSVAKNAVDLNLKLMRWRVLPSLDVGLLKRTKCLLLGAGTLGCAVARTLLGWGFRHISFVDNGSVSLSNPVRQSLFEFADSLNGGKPKAVAAAAALRRILPDVVSEGHVLTIRMPGHRIHQSDAAAAKSQTEQLFELIRAHDVVFLLTDSRESRWLPTLVAKAEGKLLINAALGFDTFVVMRHGVFAPQQQLQQEAEAGAENKEQGEVRALGCYFCSDVVAPTDSLSDRTLDQQCTVTRPGNAPIAAALAVELAVNVLHHERGAAAGCTVARGGGGGVPDGEMGALPHQIRGFLRKFEMVSVTGEFFPACTACSHPVVAAYRAEGWAFVERVLNAQSAAMLEELSGVAAIKRQAEAMTDLDCDWDSDEGGL